MNGKQAAALSLAALFLGGGSAWALGRGGNHASAARSHLPAVMAGLGARTVVARNWAEIDDPAHVSRAPDARTEILSAPLVGRIFGTCPAGARAWTLRFLNDSAANDFVALRVGSFAPTDVDVPVGEVLSWKLPPNRARTRQPADRLTHEPALTLRTTETSRLTISQGTEARIARVDVRLTVTTATGDAPSCAPVQSQITARTYPTGDQPTAPTTIQPPSPIPTRTAGTQTTTVTTASP